MNTETKTPIETVQEKLNALVAVRPDLDAYGQELALLHDAYAGDPAAQALIVRNWELAQAAVTSHEIAGDALELAAEYEAAHTDLLDAMDRQDENHPAVSQLVELVREDAYEAVDEMVWEARSEAMSDAANEAYDAARDNLYDIAVEHLEKFFRVDGDLARRLATVILDGMLGLGIHQIPRDALEAIGTVAEEQLRSYL